MQRSKPCLKLITDEVDYLRWLTYVSGTPKTDPLDIPSITPSSIKSEGEPIYP